MSWIFLESLLALGALLFTVNFFLLVYWRRSGRGKPLLIGLGLALVLLIVQAAVVTQREHAARILQRIEDDLVASRVDSLALSLAPDFAAHEREREEFVAYVERWLQRVDVRWLERQRITVEESARDEFTISVGYRAGIANGYAGTFFSRWRLTFAATPQGWRITHIEPEPTPLFPVQDWHALDRL